MYQVPLACVAPVVSMLSLSLCHSEPVPGRKLNLQHRSSTAARKLADISVPRGCCSPLLALSGSNNCQHNNDLLPPQVATQAGMWQEHLPCNNLDYVGRLTQQGRAAAQLMAVRQTSPQGTQPVNECGCRATASSHQTAQQTGMQCRCCGAAVDTGPLSYLCWMQSLCTVHNRHAFCTMNPATPRQPQARQPCPHRPCLPLHRPSAEQTLICCSQQCPKPTST